MNARDNHEGVFEVIGVDGCRSGWLVAQRARQSREITVAIVEQFHSILDMTRNGAALVLVDMPIGLATGGRRACERLAREKIGRRRSSVFSAPRRPMLEFTTYEAANAWGKAQGPEAGGGLSKQAWHILPKIREIDAVITPEDQRYLREAHPEVAFTRLGGKPCAHSKRTRDGAPERVALLAAHGVDADALGRDLRRIHPRKADFANDDLYDALALMLAAEAHAHAEGWTLSDGARDARGLKMEICG
jgi:predicted RNase H-like nuclease